MLITKNGIRWWRRGTRATLVLIREANFRDGLSSKRGTAPGLTAEAAESEYQESYRDFQQGQRKSSSSTPLTEGKRDRKQPKMLEK